ncbi:MAG: beta-hydroxyacyl-ACP dehydratase [Phycisphaerales bacterium]|nr:beta-hydroxyacyl-ACP dehydratase [Phycisphaerales bacterium]MCB9840857.1 beta-hydroxyacyl-ACP dehydratase [Phycisphaeraceae bacterium]
MAAYPGGQLPEAGQALASDRRPGEVAAPTDGADGGEGRFIFDLTGIDLSARIADRAEIARWNPHRHEMALLDAIVWTSPDRSKGVAVLDIRGDEWWVRGHFPDKALYPGVLQIECGAQLACYLFNSRRQEPVIAAFLRIQEAAFRSMVEPGDTLHILCQDIKFGRRKFVCGIQGIVGSRIAFEATISGMSMAGR